MDAHDIIDAIVESRGIKDLDHFLNPIEDDLLPLDAMTNVDKASEIVLNAIYNRKKLGILYDTDLDGVTSGAILTRYLSNFLDTIITHINRGKQHGLINTMWCDCCDVVIIVDSLNSTIDEYRSLYDVGIETIVLDHHAINPKIPYDEYVTLVSSQRDYANPALSGAGVVWKFCKYLDEKTGAYFADDYVDLAAAGILADVCDVGEENYENRYIVYKGLKNLKNPALKKIIGSYEFNSKAVLFSVAPLINACCRCGDNDIAMKMFLEDDNKKLLAYKKQLESYREIQNEEVAELLPNVQKQIKDQTDLPVLDIKIETPYGISGLLGNKLLEQTNKPLFVTASDDDDYIYGSMRSIGYGDFRTLCNNTGLIKVMGHEEAAGFECNKQLYNKFLNQIRKQISGLTQTTTSEINIDAEITIYDLNRELINMVSQINFVSGNGFKPLTFKVVGADNYEISNFKQGRHLVVKPKDYILFINWNWNGSYEELEDNAMMCDEFVAYGELEQGWLVRSFVYKVIMSDYEV